MKTRRRPGPAVRSLVRQPAGSISELIEAYFVRGIRSANIGAHAPVLASRHYASRAPSPATTRRSHH